MALTFNEYQNLYAFLKLRYPLLAEEVENALIDDPLKTYLLLDACSNFIADPVRNIRYDLLTHSFLGLKMGHSVLGKALNSQDIKFPCEIGKFLLSKLTYAPKGLRACNELIDHYKSYDLQRINVSMNEAIVQNHPDAIEKDVKALTEILDNVWNDKTIPIRIKSLNIGLPFTLGAIGEIVAGPVGGIGGLLAGLGFDVGTKILESNIEGLDERVSKMFCRNYQVNIFDFKKKYKNTIVE